MASEKPLHTIFLDPGKKINVERFHLSAAEVNSPSKYNWQIHKWRLEGGRQEGVDVIELNNGRLRTLILPSRGMSVMWVRSATTRLHWFSPVQEVVHPRHMNLQNQEGRGWLEGFNEMMTRCGLEFAGEPSRDQVIDRNGNKAPVHLTLNGRIANLPAQKVEFRLEENGRMSVRAQLEEILFNGSRLELWTEISTFIGSDTIVFKDEIMNIGSQEQEFQFVYLFSFGSPFLRAGAQFIGPIQEVIPLDEQSTAGADSYNLFAGPGEAVKQESFCLIPNTKQSEDIQLAIQNPDKTQAVVLSYSTTQLPKLTLVKQTAKEREGYRTSLLLGTSYPYSRPLERAAGRVPKLKPGERRLFSIQMQVIDTEDAINVFQGGFSNLAADKPPKISKPPLLRPQKEE